MCEIKTSGSNCSKSTYASSSCKPLGRFEILRPTGSMPHNHDKAGPSFAEGTQVKEELKLAIQNRRASQGLNALQLPIKTERTSSYELSHEEQLKILRRRERNKVAASRCREKKKQRLEELQKEADELEDSNGKLAREIIQLRAEMDCLATDLRTHRCALVKVSSSKDAQRCGNS